MVIYEVNLKIRNDAAADFAAWLHPHIEQLLRFDGFVSAVWLEVEQEDPEHVFWTTQYYLESREDLESYLINHAAEMREDGIRRFGDRFSATRRIMRQRERFEQSAE